jgi:hypothetical protein
LASLADAYPTANGSNQRLLSFSSSSPTAYATTNVTFDAGGTTTGGTMTVWEQLAPNSAWTAKTEKAAYEIRTVNGQQLMVITPPASVIANRKGNPAQEQFFAVRDGKLYGGTQESIAYQNYRSGGQNWNDVAMNALLAGAGFPTVVK